VGRVIEGRGGEREGDARCRGGKGELEGEPQEGRYGGGIRMGSILGKNGVTGGVEECRKRSAGRGGRGGGTKKKKEGAGRP